MLSANSYTKRFYGTFPFSFLLILCWIIRLIGIMSLTRYSYFTNRMKEFYDLEELLYFRDTCQRSLNVTRVQSVSFIDIYRYFNEIAMNFAFKNLSLTRIFYEIRGGWHWRRLEAALTRIPRSTYPGVRTTPRRRRMRRISCCGFPFSSILFLGKDWPRRVVTPLGAVSVVMRSSRFLSGTLLVAASSQ